ncbi:hypothetical protein GMB51_13850 [Turicibacter sanguinis]|nr:hypothetical protein [Turicibacter sanguinis]MTN52036.1 hypothetical protein [Turicibacter sanguinis]MTN55094.1 hypothetical protein [Turicibacter sanguinis]MTN58301.1 hypothetical protein [Turicibacter sanguinis]MTN61391.1 hypothetical protein [Turicibacter sanguinis]
MKAKEILRNYSYDLKRVAMLEYDLKCIDSQVPIKVTDYSQDQGGSGGGLEDKYWDRIEKKKLIEMELEVLKPGIARVEKALELIRSTHELECDAMLLRHIRNKSNAAIEIALGISVNTVTKKVKHAERELEMLYENNLF